MVVFSQLMELPSSITQAHQEIVNLHALMAMKESEFTSRIQLQSFEILRLQEKNAELVRKLYGASSEKRVVATRGDGLPQQGELSLGESVEPSAPEPTIAEPTTVSSHTRAPSKKKRLEGDLDPEGRFPEHLQRVPVVIDDGEAAGKVMSKKTTERLCVSPSQFYVEVITRVVRKHEDGTVVEPPARETPLPRRCVDVSFLVHVITMKFLWHLPLYRQEQMLKAQGIAISRNTLIRYVIDVATLLSRLYDELLKHVFMATEIFADETPVLVGKGKKGQRQFTESRFWPFLGNNSIVFLFAKTRAAKEIEPLLEAYKGYLQVDGYKVYETVARKFPDIVLVFCWAHARRKFIEAEKYFSKEAAEALRYIRVLYRIEGLGKESPPKLLRLRQRFSRRVLTLFKGWLDQQLSTPTLLPKSSLGTAITYTLARWEGLNRYTEDAALSIDSNPIERQIRPVAIGRKNWLFCASETGAESACILYSLIASCKLNGIDPHAYLVDVLNRINDHSQLRLQELLPHNWKPLEKIKTQNTPDG